MGRFARYLACGALAVAVLAPPAEASPQLADAVPTSYALDLSYDSAGAGTIAGTETIRFRNAGPAPIDHVWLRLWANGPDHCKPAAIAVAVSAPATAEPLQVDCTVLPVKLGAAVPPGQSGQVALSIAINGRRAEDRFGRFGLARLFGNVIPVLSVRDQLGLHLEPYGATGEAFYSLAARWDATIRMPESQHAATTGAVTGESVAGGTRTIAVSTPQARDFALAFGPFKVVSGSARGVAVRVFAKNRRAGRAALRVAKRSIRIFSRRFGPYGSTEYDVVLLPTPFFFGMEYPELVFTAPEPAIVAHETAHQWWYGIVGDNQALEPWLDESFASYSDHYAIGGFKRCKPRRPFSILPRAWRKLQLDAPMSVWDGRSARYGGVVYEVGACVLGSLERSIGKRRMTDLFRLLISRHRFGVMDQGDVLRAIAEVAPGLSLSRFMRRAHISG